MKTAVLIFVLSLMSGAHVSAKSRVTMNVQYDQTAYSLELDAKTLVFRKGGQKLVAKLRPCSDSILNSYIQNLNTSLKTSSAETVFSPVWVSSADVSRAIARGSNLGTWLRELPRRVFYDFAEAEAQCRNP